VKKPRGFSLIELLVVLGILAMLAALLFPALGSVKKRARTASCLANLKQIGVCSITYSSEHDGRFPAMPNTNRFLSPLQPILKELRTPKLFVCPADRDRIPSKVMSSLDRSNTSYFVSYTAGFAQPAAILAGDRNITTDGALNTGAMQFARTNNFGWWRNIHEQRGNILLSDGSVHGTSTNKLTSLTSSQPTPVFSWYIPNGDWVRTPP
jgi:prepilin-type N-terminal cleavage/methylation domain-containing protein